MPGGGDPRESATESRPPTGLSRLRARVKGCGKSAPRDRQRKRHGKPHREQDRIGVAYGPVPARRPGWLLERRSDPPPRGMVAYPFRGWTEPGLQTLWRFYLRARHLPCWRSPQSPPISPRLWRVPPDPPTGASPAGAAMARRARPCRCGFATAMAATSPATVQRPSLPTAPSAGISARPTPASTTATGTTSKA